MGKDIGITEPLVLNSQQQHLAKNASTSASFYIWRLMPLSDCLRRLETSFSSEDTHYNSTNTGEQKD